MLAWLALAATAARAAELVIEDPEQRFSRLNLQATAEKVLADGHPYVLIRIHATRARTIDLSTGGSDTVSLESYRLEFLPMTIGCDRMVLQAGGKTLHPDTWSLCTEPMRLGSDAAVPVFVAFKFPDAADARLTVPVTVTRPDPPVQRRRDDRPGPVLYRPRVDEALLGSREITVRIFLK